jgi:hypothetical protein
VSTKIGIIAEGVIDLALLPPLLERIAQERAQFRWPLNAEDVAEIFPIRKRGHGGVLDTVRKLVKALDTQHFDHAFFVILLDRRTYAVQAKIKKLIRGKGRFILGIAIEEIEAWWLGDRTNTLQWSGLTKTLPPNCRYSVTDYQAERDDNPKATLDELTCHSRRFDRCYGQGNLDLAAEFAENFWRPSARLDEIVAQCPRGYAPFERAVVDRFRHVQVVRGKLFS